MRVALGQVPALTDDYITYAQQLGVSSIHLNTPGVARFAAVGSRRPARASSTCRGCRPPAGGDRERPKQLLHGRDARRSRTRRGDRELRGDHPRTSARPASRSSATTSSRPRSGAPRRGRTAGAARSSPATTMRSHSIPSDRTNSWCHVARRRRTTRSSGARSTRPTACSTTTRCGRTTSTSSRP